MKLGKRTERLVREAMVLGFVEGVRWAGGLVGDLDDYPPDSAVQRRVYKAAHKFNDLYPLLSKVERDE